MKRYKAAVFGATVLAAPIAEKLKEKAIIIEKSESVAIDYTSCINMKLSKIGKCSKAETKSFFEEIKKRNLADKEGRVHIFPIAGILAKSFLKANTLLATDVISVKKIDGEYEINIFNISGFSSFRAEYIIDTTATGVFNIDVENLNFTKYINAAINAENTDEAHLLQRGRFENEFLYSLEAEKDTKYEDAVRLLHRKWQSLAETELKGCELTAIAPQFAYIFDEPAEEKLDDKYIFKPSASLGSLGEAYEEGVNVSELFI